MRCGLLFGCLLTFVAGGCVQQQDPARVTAIAAASRADALTEQAVSDFVRREMATRNIAGLAVAVVADGRVLLAQGHGSAHLPAARPVRADTPFLIASLTKMFTAAAILILVEEGQISLTSAIGDHIPNLPAAWRRVTVRQLLTHTSGINSYTSHDTPPCGRSRPESAYTPADVIAEVACTPLDFAPGSDWRYSDTNYILLGLLIERAGGKPYARFLEERIFAPLQMDNTRLMRRPGDTDNRATGYFWIDGGFRTGPDQWPAVEFSTGGLVSTLDDLARFDRALATGSLLPLPVLHAMWRPEGIGSARYGFGFSSRPVAGRAQVGHTGGGPAAATSFARFLDDGITVIVLTNTGQPPGAIQEMVGGVADLYLARNPPVAGWNPAN